MSSFQAVIFDMDGTLADSLPLCIEAFRQALGPFVRKELFDDEIYSAFGPSDEGTIRIFAPDNVEAAMEEFLKHYKRLHSTLCPKPFDGAVELLQELRQKKVPVGLVTGKGPQSLAITLDELKLGGYFDAVQTGSPFHANKPECLRNILKQFDLEPHQAVYVGDAPSDITACREVGMSVYAAAWAATANLSKLESLNPDKIVYSIAALREILFTELHRTLETSVLTEVAGG